MKTQEICPVCGQYHDYLLRHFHPDLDKPLLEKLTEEAPGWLPEMGACTRCLDQAHLAFQRCFFEGTGEPGEVNGYKILPTPMRLFASEKWTGKGVTICFIDSGFYLHPDLIFPKNRILKLLDITQPDRGEDYFSQPNGNAWHGTMTSVVAAGNGRLSSAARPVGTSSADRSDTMSARPVSTLSADRSDRAVGMYRGIASGANLVLLKVTDNECVIRAENIVRALDWAVKNSRKYRIKIINLSVSDDEVGSWQTSEIDRAVERAVAKGITVVAAAGNDPNAPLRPPANAPHALTVGGLNDRNTLDPLLNTLYHSTFGETVDQFQKPDLIAPAIWLAAPILPGTKEQAEAAALFDLFHASDDLLKLMLETHLPKIQLDASLLFENHETIRSAIAERIDQAKYISPNYQHADGTSFAAPIVCSVIAQMLEANPRLDPATIREILLVTARKLPGEQAERQGWGVVQPAHAVQMAAGQPLAALPGITPVVDFKRMQIDFHLQHPTAKQVELTGDFFQWKERKALKTNGVPGIWQAGIPLHASGTFRYKFVIDEKEWMSDPRNLYREGDGFGGFNSKLIVV